MVFTAVMASEHLTSLSLVEAGLEDAKALDIVVIDVRGRTTITDFVVIATGTSSRHVQAVADQVLERVKRANGEVLGVEGREAGKWVLLDLNDTVVHVMQSEARTFYDLEQLWQTEHEAFTEAD